LVVAVPIVHYYEVQSMYISLRIILSWETCEISERILLKVFVSNISNTCALYSQHVCWEKRLVTDVEVGCVTLTTSQHHLIICI